MPRLRRLGLGENPISMRLAPCRKLAGVTVLARCKMVVATALGISTSLVVLDRMIFLAASWRNTGVAALRDVGIDLGNSERWAFPKSVAAFVARGTIAVSFSALTGVFGAQLLLASDLATQRELSWKTVNAVPIANAERVVDMKSATPDAVASVQAEIDRVSSEASSLHLQAADPSSANPIVKQARDDVVKLTAELAQTRSEGDSAQQTLSDETLGVQSGGTSGRKGNGPRAQSDAAKAKIIGARETQETADLAAAQKRLDIEVAQFANTSGATEQVMGQLRPIDDELAADRQQLAGLNAKETSLVKSRSDEIDGILIRDPNFVPRDTGLLGDIAALEDLEKRPGAFGVTVLIQLVALSIDYRSWRGEH